MLNLEIFTDKFGESGRRLILMVYEEAIRRGHRHLGPEHLFLCFAKLTPSFFNALMGKLELAPEVVLQQMELRLSQNEYPGQGVRISEPFRSVLNNALRLAKREDRQLIESTDLLAALFEGKSNLVSDLFEQKGVSREIVVQKIQNQVSIKRE